MKKIANHLILISLVLITSCGSRKVHLKAQEAQTEQKEQREKNNIQEIEVEKIVRDTVFVEKIVQVQNAETEKNHKTKKHKEYFPDGSLKSETETSETQEISRLESELQQFKEVNISLYTENQNLKSEIQTLEKSEFQEKSKTKDKQSDRKSYPWWQWLIGGYLIGKIIEIGLKSFINFNLVQLKV